MKFAKLIVALAGTLLVLAVLVLPQVIEAKRARAALASMTNPQGNSHVIVGASTHNDKSPPLRDMKQLPMTFKPEHEANDNPKIPHSHKDSKDTVVQSGASAPISAAMPGTQTDFDGIPFTGIARSCPTADANGLVSATPYCLTVTEGDQALEKPTGA